MATQLLTAGLDPTGFTSISGAELLQMIQAAVTANGVGMGLTTTDVAGVPVVPAADTETMLQRFIWRRITATGIILYSWNPLSAPDATLKNWVNFLSISIPTGSVTNLMLAGGITDDKISAISYSKVTGAPTALPPNGPAGGELSGTYPNPLVANQAINTQHIHPNVGAKLVQRVFAQTGEEILIDVAVAGNVLPSDDTIPQKTEGVNILTTPQFTPKSLTNYLYFRCSFEFSIPDTNPIVDFVTAIFANQVDGGVNDDALTGKVFTTSNGTAGTMQNWAQHMLVEGFALVSDVIASLEALTFQARVGIHENIGQSGNICINGKATRKLGGVQKAVLIVEEYRP